MVDDDGVSMTEDKAMETSTLAVICGEYTKEIGVGFGIEGGDGGSGTLARGRSGWRRGLEGLS